jgi:ATP-dependent Clp protease ATP-binding subunit ClpC
MFERYTEKARRVIFFARYEASQFGSPEIETEHLLLGLLREDKALTNRFLHSHGSVESIRKAIEQHTTVREKTSTSVDLPLSNESKRVLAYAAEEAERLGHKHIGTEHLLLGLLREEKCFASLMLKERGIDLAKVREELARVAHVPEQGSGLGSQDFSQDLTQAALDGQLEPVIGRNAEIEATIEVLAGYRNGNPILVGEPGSGRTAIVSALAQRIADGNVPPFLAEKRILLFDTALGAGTGRMLLREKMQAAEKMAAEDGATILFVGDLRSLLEPTSVFLPWGPGRILRQSPLHGKIRCIATSTPAELDACMRQAQWLSERFRAIHVRPFNDNETLEVLKARRQTYEKFHEVTYSDEALTTVVNESGRYLADRVLPGKALQLIDAAGARVKLRQPVVSPEAAEIRKKINFIVRRRDSAIQNHEFEKARFYSEEERKEREILMTLQREAKVPAASSSVVRAQDVEEVIARWDEYPFQP